VTGHLREEKRAAAPFREPPPPGFIPLAPLLAPWIPERRLTGSPDDGTQHTGVADRGLFT